MVRYYRAYRLNNGNYAVALYDESRNMHHRKMTAEKSQLTGAHTYYARNLTSDLGGTFTEFKTLSETERYAREHNKELK